MRTDHMFRASLLMVAVSVLPSLAWAQSGTATGMTVKPTGTDTAVSLANSVPVTPQAFGLVGDGVTSNSVAWGVLAAATTSPTVRFGKGTYLMGCTDTYNMASNISLVGDSGGGTILKMPAACTRAGGTNLFSWAGRLNVVVRDLTIDLNDMVVTGSGSNLFAPIVFRGGDNPLVDHVNIINGAKRMNLVAVVGQDAITRYTITNSYLHITTPSTEYNQCILVSAPLEYPVSGGYIAGNTCVNTGMAVGGSSTIVTGNDVYGWAFGSGIYAPVGDNHHHLQVIGNAFHDGAASPGLDENDTPTHGIEVHSAYPLIAHNNIWNNGGSGIASFSKHGKIDNNWIYGNGHRVDTTTGYGIFAAYQNEGNNGNYTSITNNYVRDDGSGHQVYAYFEMTHDSAGGPYNFVYGNDFKGETGKISLNADSATTTSAPGLVQTKLNVMSEAGSYSFPTPQIGGHFHVFLSGAGVITDYGVVLPACDAHSDANMVSVAAVVAINSVAITAASGSVNFAPKSLAAGQSYTWVCRGASTSWFAGPGAMTSGFTAGKPPTVSSCGTSPGTVSGNSKMGRVTWGTGSPTACTLTFVDTPWTTTPKCVGNMSVSAVPVLVAATSTSSSAVTFTLAAGASSGILVYMCGQTQ